MTAVCFRKAHRECVCVCVCVCVCASMWHSLKQRLREEAGPGFTQHAPTPATRYINAETMEPERPTDGFWMAIGKWLRAWHLRTRRLPCPRTGWRGALAG